MIMNKSTCAKFRSRSNNRVTKNNFYNTKASFFDVEPYIVSGNYRDTLSEFKDLSPDQKLRLRQSEFNYSNKYEDKSFLNHTMYQKNKKYFYNGKQDPHGNNSKVYPVKREDLNFYELKED